MYGEVELLYSSIENAFGVLLACVSRSDVVCAYEIEKGTKIFIKEQCGFWNNAGRAFELTGFHTARPTLTFILITVITIEIYGIYKYNVNDMCSECEKKVQIDARMTRESKCIIVPHDR